MDKIKRDLKKTITGVECLVNEATTMLGLKIVNNLPDLLDQVSSYMESTYSFYNTNFSNFKTIQSDPSPSKKNQTPIVKYQYAICNLPTNKKFFSKNILISFKDLREDTVKDAFNGKFIIKELDADLNFIRSYQVIVDHNIEDFHDSDAVNNETDKIGTHRYKSNTPFTTQPPSIHYVKDANGKKLLEMQATDNASAKKQREAYQIIDLERISFSIIRLARDCFDTEVEGDWEIEFWQFLSYLSILLAKESESHFKHNIPPKLRAIYRNDEDLLKLSTFVLSDEKTEDWDDELAALQRLKSNALLEEARLVMEHAKTRKIC